MTGTPKHLTCFLSLGLAILLLSGCGQSKKGHSAHGADELRLHVPGMLTVDQRRALFYADAAQELDPTVAGNWLLQSVASGFRGVGQVFTPGGPSITTATRTSTAVITADVDDRLAIWNPNSGRQLGSVRSKTRLVRLAASPSPYLIASVDTMGEIAMWNLEDPQHPVELPLRGGTVVGKRVIALGFATRSTRLLALTTTGEIYVFDVLAHKRIAVRSLLEARGKLPWSDRRGPLRLSAASIITPEYSPSTTLLVATLHHGVARIAFSGLRGHIEIPGADISGTVAYIEEYSMSRTIVLGTSVGTINWNGKYHGATVEHTGPSLGLALQGSTLTAATAQGLASVDLATAETLGTSLSSFGGRPARALIGGPGGALELDRDGSISLLTSGETGVNLRTSNAEAGIVAHFGPEGNLLETSGSDTNHVDSLIAVRPGVPGVAGRELEPNEVTRRYSPSKAWWPSTSTTSRGLFIDDAAIDDRYVVAGGQDPTETAVVLVWDAKTGRPLKRLALTESGIKTEGLITAQPSLVSGVELLPKRHLVAAYSALQELIVIWSTDSWQRYKTIDVGPISTFSVSSNESTLLVDSLSDKQSEAEAGNANTRLLFVNLDSGNVEREVVSEGTDLAAYGPQGGLIAVKKGGIIRQLSPDGRRDTAPPLKLEQGEPTSIAWKPRSTILAVGMKDNGGVRMVDLATDKVSDALPSTPGTEPVDVSFSPDGKLLAASNATEEHSQAAPSIWKLDDQTLESRVCALVGGALRRDEWRRWTNAIPFTALCSQTASTLPSHANMAAAR